VLGGAPDLRELVVDRPKETPLRSAGERRVEQVEGTPDGRDGRCDGAPARRRAL